MGSIKTAISIQKPLFERAEELARKMSVSRSHLFGLALEDYIRRRESQELLQRINAADADEPDEAERAVLKGHRRQHRRMLEGEW
jgi:predicted transcriptional regulator